jgi:putative ATPase
VQGSRNDPVPLHLRNAPTNVMRQLGYGEGYRYAHDDYAAMDAQGDLPPAQPLQSNLPEALAGRQYFRPGKQGAEARLQAWLDQRRGPPHDEPDPFADEDA